MGAIVTYDLTKRPNNITFGTVVVNRIDNPFDPIGSKVTKTDIHGLTLDKYLDGYCLGANLLVSLNGSVVKDYDSIIIKPNDVITYTNIVQGGGGGGGGKQILTLVAMIALTVVSGGLGAVAMGGTFAGGLAGLSGMALIGGSLIASGIMIAGSLLINSVIGGASGSSGLTSKNPSTESATYSWTGIQTSRDLNTPIPVLYGTHMLGGTVINSRFYYDSSDDWIGTQLALCHGEIENITPDKITVNEAKYSSYVSQSDSSNGWFQYRTGKFDQPIMNGYSDSIYNNGNVSRKLEYNDPYVFQSESTNINFFRLHFEFPNGLYKLNKKNGNKEAKTVIIRAKYRKLGTSTWYDIYSYNTKGNLEWEYQKDTSIVWSTADTLSGYTKTGNYRYTKDANFVPSNNLTFTAATGVPIKSFFEPVDAVGNALVLEATQYEFSVTRLTVNDTAGDNYNQSDSHMRFLEEINTTDLNYGGIALLGIDLKATGQLSNSRPNFTTLCTRKPLKIGSMYVPSNSPAWACLDVLLNKNYGMGLSLSDVDLPAFTRWASFCDGGIANTFTLDKTIPSLENNHHIITGDLVIPATDLPDGETLSLDRLDRNTSTCTAYGRTLVNNVWVNKTMTDADINSITYKYITGHSILADGYYYVVSFAYDLLTDSELTYSLVFKDKVYVSSPKLQFNGIFDTSSDIWTALQDIAQVGRGQVILRGNKYSCMYDDVKTVKGLFNAANSKDVTVQYISNADIASEIEVQFTDKNIGYEMNSISVQDINAMSSNITSNKTTKQIKGITSEAEALIMGRYLLATSKFLRRAITLTADIESITATVGDLIAVQTDVTQYGIGGIILQKLGDSGSLGNSVILDTTVTLKYGEQYILKIKNNLTDDIKDYVFTPTKAAQISYTFDDSNNLTVGVLKFDDFYLVINNEYGEYLETNTLVMAEGYDIYEGDRYSFGVQGSDSVLCTITEISRDGELSRQITAIEYNESILDFNYDNDMIQRLEPTGKPKNIITNFTATDRLVKLDVGQVVAMVSFGWDTKISSYYNIYILETNGFKHYLGNNIRENRFEYPNTVLIPEKPYTIYVEDINDMSIVDKLVYTVTSFSAVPDDIQSFTIIPTQDSLEFNISYPLKPLDFGKYNVYRNSSLVSQQISDNFIIPHVKGTNGVGYSIEVVDMINKKSNKVAQNFTTQLPVITSSDYITEGENIRLSISASKGSFDIASYVISYDSTTIRTIESTAFIKADFTGNRVFSIKAVDTLGNESLPFDKSVGINVPVPGALLGNVDGKEAVISWQIPASSIAIDYYEITYDDIIVKTKSTSYRIPVYWSGDKVFSVKTVNILGASSTDVSTSISITTGKVTKLQTEVIDNNVLLRWEGTQGSLPIENYRLFKGTDIENLTLIGDKKGTFTTIFENEAGIYTYWMGAIDSAGNLGELKYTSSKVNAPPDYVLNVNWESTFDGTSVNAKADSGGITLPINTIESIEEHFDNNFWTSPQEQVASGNTLWIQPFLLNGSYEETRDYGLVLTNSLVTLGMTYTNILGEPTISTVLSLSVDGSVWVDYPNQAQVYGTNFRYVKVKIDVTGENEGLNISALNIKLDSKIKNDSGSGTANASDVGGTTVTFNKEFIDITAISVTPSGTTPLIPIYDFVDTANPTSFKVLLYNTSGVRANGSFSWSARGY